MRTSAEDFRARLGHRLPEEARELNIHDVWRARGGGAERAAAMPAEEAGDLGLLVRPVGGQGLGIDGGLVPGELDIGARELDVVRSDWAECMRREGERSRREERYSSLRPFGNRCNNRSPPSGRPIHF
jgi:hypothetical protein